MPSDPQSSVTVYDPNTGLPVQVSPYSVENQPEQPTQDQMNYATSVKPQTPVAQPKPAESLTGLDTNPQPNEESLGMTVSRMINQPINLPSADQITNVLKGFGSAGESLGRGAVAAVPGMFGDINKLGQEYIQPNLPEPIQSTLQGMPAAPTTEDYLNAVPRVSPQFGDQAANNFMEGLGGALLPIGASTKTAKEIAEAENLAKPTLNMSPRITAANIKGPASQEVGAMLNQVKGIPGVTKEGLKVGAEELHALDPKTKITKEEFASKLKHEHGFEKHDLAYAADSPNEHILDIARNNVNEENVMRNMGIDRRYAREAMDYHATGNPENLSAEAWQHLHDIDLLDYNRFTDAVDLHYGDALNDEINRLEQAGFGEQRNMDKYKYEPYQRLVSKGHPDEKYYEIGITHPDQVGETYRHYQGGSAPEGLIGHTRGTYSEEPIQLHGGVKTEPKSAVIEEIQSDAQQKADQTGHLHQVHGTIFKGAVQHALEQGADHVYYPSTGVIKSVRGYLPDQAPHLDIYDKDIMKEGVGPLTSVPGVNIEPILNDGPRANPDIPILYHKFSFTPEAKDIILNGVGQPTPGYKSGGQIKSKLYFANDLDAMKHELLRKR
jgi:hypothetical protein